MRATVVNIPLVPGLAYSPLCSLELVEQFWIVEPVLLGGLRGLCQLAQIEHPASGGPEHLLRLVPVAVILDGQREPLHRIVGKMPTADDVLEQVGELQNIWLWGPVIQVAGSGATTSYQSTVHTLSEILVQAANDDLNGRIDPDLAVQPDPVNPFDPFDTSIEAIPLDLQRILGSKDEYVNRLQLADSNRPAMPGRGLFGPALPPGAVLFDAFTCNDWGIGPVTDTDLDGVIDDELYGRYFNNAIAYTSSSTPLHALDGRAEPVA